MKLTKYILPITAVAGVGSMVAPLAVSCNASDTAKLEWTYEVDTTDTDTKVTEYETKYDVIQRGQYTDIKDYNNKVYLPQLKKNRKIIADALLEGYHGFMERLVDVPDIGFTNIDNGRVSIRVGKTKIIDGSDGYRYLKTNITIRNHQLITTSDGTKITVNYSLKLNDLELSLFEYNSNCSLVDSSMKNGEFTNYYSPFNERNAVLGNANDAIDSKTNDNFRVTLNYSVTDNARGGSEKTQKVTWTPGYAKYITADVFTLGGKVTCADAMLSLADAFENATSIDRNA